MRWSEREGLREVRQAIQDSGMDDPLRNGLWDALDTVFLRRMVEAGLFTSYNPLRGVMERVWVDCRACTIDSIPSRTEKAVADLRSFFFTCGWPDVYEVLEVCAQAVPEVTGAELARVANEALDKHKSAWHFVGKDLVRRMGEEETQALAQALDCTGPHAEVREQLRKALACFSSRERPDYHNAIKEAVSALETVGRLIVHDRSAPLGDALKRIEAGKLLRVHGSLLASYRSLYGYASDEGRVRHGAKAGSHTNVGLPEAQAMLGACAAAVSYLIAKANEAGVPLTMDAP